MKIYAFHLLNDYSGSPKVLMQLIKGWVKNDVDVHLSSSLGQEGFLSNLENVSLHPFNYSLASNPYIRLMKLTLSQVALFFSLIFKVKKDDIIYINTVLPFGAAFLGKIKGCRVIYHVHETTMNPPIFKKFIFGMVKWAASDVIYVSQFLSEQEPMNIKTHILYNAIETSFLEKAKKNRSISMQPKNALMVCSLKDYKGVNEFVILAKDNLNYQFKLVLNADQKSIDSFFSGQKSPSNLRIYDTQKDLHSFYKWADVILNLSRPDGWVETFGLTIIEGMAYGCPAIIPPVGGITELVEQNVNGFMVDCRDRDLLNKTLQFLFANVTTFRKMAIHSTEKIENYSEDVFRHNSLGIIHKKVTKYEKLERMRR